MKQWRDELIKIKENEIDFFNEELSRLFNRSLTEHGRDTVGRLIKKYTLKKCIDMLYTVSEKSLPDDIDYVNYVERCLKLEDVCVNDPYLKDTFYIRKIIINRFTVNDRNKIELKEAIYDNLRAGVDKDCIISVAKSSKSVWAFLEWLSEDY